MSRELILEHPSLHSMVDQANLVFNQVHGRPDLITHFGSDSPVAIPAAEFFDVKLGAPVATFDELMNRTVKDIRGIIGKLIETAGIAVHELQELLGTATQYWYDTLVSASLDAIYEFCFNDHGSEHIRHTTQRALSLAIQASCSMEEQFMLVIAAELHDMGNVFNRGVHSLIIALWFRKLVHDLELPEHMQKTIENAMAVHDDDIANLLIDEFIQQGHTEEEVIAYMRETFGTVGLSLIIADKVEIGHWRTSPKLRKNAARQTIRAALQEDRHLTVNLFGEFKEIAFFNEDQTSMQMRIEFNLQFIQKLRNSLGQRFLEVVAAGEEDKKEERLMVPDRMKRYWKENQKQVNYFSSWLMELGELYRERLQLLVRSTFALYPQLEEFQFHFHDPELDQTKVYIVTKSNLRATFERNPFLIDEEDSRQGNFQVIQVFPSRQV